MRSGFHNFGYRLYHTWLEMRHGYTLNPSRSIQFRHRPAAGQDQTCAWPASPLRRRHRRLRAHACRRAASHAHTELSREPPLLDSKRNPSKARGARSSGCQKFTDLASRPKTNCASRAAAARASEHRFIVVRSNGTADKPSTSCRWQLQRGARGGARRANVREDLRHGRCVVGLGESFV